jgi:4-hydroxy-tetrahydrodipicolinate synthase
MMAKLSLELEGVYTPIVAPMHANGDLDLDGFAKVIEFCIAGGVRGLVANGTTGEYYALSTDERTQLARKAVEVAAGRARMVAGCNAGSTREVIAHGLVARDLGYDALMLAAPYTSLPTQRELAAHYASVASEVGLPIILYNYPARAGIEIGFECLDAVVDIPEIVGIKESSGDFSRFLAMRKRYAGKIEIMCGSDDQAVDYFVWGVRSWLAGTSNVLPKHHVMLLNASLRGDHAEAVRIFDGMLPWVQNMESGSYNQKAKLGLGHQGIQCGDVRQPLLPLLDDVAAETLRVLDQALALDLG